jgi:hypothetical protein
VSFVIWSRAHFTTGGGPGQIALIALSPSKLPDPLPISSAKHGMPRGSSGAAAVTLVARDRAEDSAWFDEQVVSPFAELIASDLGGQVADAARGSQHAYVIEGEVADPEDLSHIQAAWALAKCLCEQGADVVIDVYAARAHLGADVAALDPKRGFDVLHEVTLFFDEAGDGTFAAWSLGLRKFGRPDLVVLGIAADAATQTALMLRDVAVTLAAGERIEPGDLVGTPDGARLAVAAFESGSAPVVAVDGPAVVLVPQAEPSVA